MLVSVITPVYNEEKNIQKCYKSLCQQSFKDFEWVIIDDGSTDKSVEIIESIITSHPEDSFSIKLLKQKNSGAAIARKLGIEKVQGEFICPLDADDYLSPDALGLAIDKISDNIDIVYFNLNHINTDGVVERKFQHFTDTWPISGKTAFGECVDGWGVPGLGLIKRTLYDKAYSVLKINLNIIVNNIGEDELITRYIMYYATLINRCEGIYYYVNNPKSTTKSVNKRFHTLLYNCIKLDEFIQDNKTKDVEEYKDWDLKSQLHLLYDFNSVFYRYIKWRKLIDNRSEWKKSLYIASNHIDLFKILTNYKRINIIRNKSFGYRYIITGLIKVVVVRVIGFVLNLKNK